jgi:hypothetical protein
MSRSARGLIGGAALGAAILCVGVLALPIQWIVAFFATTTALTVIALSVESWRASRELTAAESRVKH